MVTLGQEVFMLSREGEVVRTCVAQLSPHGYCFFNGCDHRDYHSFSFAEVQTRAEEYLLRRQVALRRELRVLSRRRKYLKTTEYQNGVMDKPQVVLDLRNIEDRNRKTTRKRIKVPETYLAVGCQVYVVITPQISPKSELVYRPQSHFVLETTIRNVCFTPDGTAHYGFTTRFQVHECFSSRKEATLRLQSMLKVGPDTPIPFVTIAEEEEGLSLIDNIPF
jgi:hypothetical protein